MRSSSKSSTTVTQGHVDDRLMADHLQYLRISDICRLLRISKPTLCDFDGPRGFPSQRG